MAQMMPFQVPSIAKVSLGQGLFAMAHHIWSPDIPIAVVRELGLWYLRMIVPQLRMVQCTSTIMYNSVNKLSNAYLIGGFKHFLFSIIMWDNPSHFIFFRGVGQPPTSDKLRMFGDRPTHRAWRMHWINWASCARSMLLPLRLAGDV